MNKKIAMLLFAVLFILSSCEKDEAVYSCDSSLNEWALENIETIQQMTRQDWIAIDDQYKQACYLAFTPEQKIRFWHEKLQQVLNLNWSIEEKTHIRLVDVFIDEHPEFFSGKVLSDNQLNELESFFYQWKKKGEAMFFWDKKVAIAIAGTGYPLLDKTGNIDAKIKKESINRGGCNCNTGLLSDFCGADGTCIRTQCVEDLLGCGWLLIQSCNGECSHWD